jgi:uncharacterized protein YndB with AHSA1/START domain
MTQESAPARVLIVRRTIASPREAVFDAWTDPDALVIWFGGALAQTLSAAIDLRPGGSYRLSMSGERGVGDIVGTYRVVDPPKRLVYTWRVEPSGSPATWESLVTVEFHDREGDTEVVVTHEGLVDDAGIAFHEAGWTASLEGLMKMLVEPR